MKKAKIVLVSVAFFAIIGGALSFRATRFDPPNLWYIPNNPAVTLTTTMVQPGIIYSTTVPNCTLDNRVTTDIGPIVNTFTRTTRLNITTIFTRSNPTGGPTLSFTTVYYFCTPIQTKTTFPNS